MQILVSAIGRLKRGPESELFARYKDRLDSLSRSTSIGPLQLFEFPESQRQTASERKADEAARLEKACAQADLVFALHERAGPITSTEFAKMLADRRDEGLRALAFVIGGPDGLNDTFLKKAPAKLSLGPMTLPHGLARIVLAEQLYRAATIIAHHPYHRD